MVFAVSAPSTLVIADLTVTRGGVPVVRRASLQVEAGRVTALLGPNGAGKTTLLEAVSGVLPVVSGSITYDGVALHPLSPEARARSGLSHVEQGRTVFGALTVEDNLRVATDGPTDVAFELFPELERRRSLLAAHLSGGEQQMLVIARALVGGPRVLLVDEISLGLAPAIVRRLMPLMRQLADEGVGVLMVEQFATVALEVADHVYVLDRGEVVFDGSATELASRPGVLHGVYLRRTGGPSAAKGGG